MAHDVFISYSSNDKAIADAVCAKLESNRIRCWIAPRDILPGTEYGQALVEAIKKSRVVVLVLSSTSNVSHQVMREVERAVSNEIPIIPLRIENVLPSESMEYYLSSVHWLDAITPPIEQHLDKLADTVIRLLAGEVLTDREAAARLKSGENARREERAGKLRGILEPVETGQSRPNQAAPGKKSNPLEPVPKPPASPLPKFLLDSQNPQRKHLLSWGTGIIALFLGGAAVIIILLLWPGRHFQAQIPTLTPFLAGDFAPTPVHTANPTRPSDSTMMVEPATEAMQASTNGKGIPLTLTQDGSGQWWVENAYYKIELSHGTSFILKTGTGAHEWRVTTNAWIWGHANTEDGMGNMYLYFSSPPLSSKIESIQAVEQTPRQVAVQIISSGSDSKGMTRVSNTLTFQVDSPAICVDANVMIHTQPSPLQTLINYFFLVPGGDTNNDYYTWSGNGSGPLSFPYQSYDSGILTESAFRPVANDYIYVSIYDANYLQGLGLVTKLADTSDKCTDTCYGRSEIIGYIYGWQPHISLNMKASSRSSYYIYPFTVNKTDPMAPIVNFINTLSP